jgi:hypothetical protein
MRLTVAAAALAWAVSAPALAQVQVPAQPLAQAPAQVPKPLPLIAFDARAFMTSVGDVTTENDLHVTATNLPSKVRGFSLGANVYLKRGPGFGIGLGGELVMGRGRHTTTDPNGENPDIKTATRLKSLSGNASMNFGQRNGWSYLSGGYGPLQLWSYLDDESPRPAPPSSMTFNFGGGARWFFSSHVAFSFDIRFYYTQPEVATDFFPGRGRKRLTLLSAGISIR